MTPSELSGYLLLNKKPGITSFEALDQVKKAFSTGKVGHTGTLDKFATGLLLVLVGKAVKLSSWFSGSDKQYEGLIRFGIETDTLDPEGATVAEGEIPSLEQLEAALPDFRGTIYQEPPVYSAIHVKGKRASDLARSGKTMSMQKRSVSVYALDLLSYKPPLAIIHVHCSKGTYIRSLARDIAIRAGSRAHLVFLNRTSIAGFQISEALDISDALNPGAMRNALQPIDVHAFESLELPYCMVDDEVALQIMHGKNLRTLIDERSLHYPQVLASKQQNGSVGVFRQQGEFLGLIEKKADTWRYGYVYARA
jgi:tRNA pseudouridine55 synthase